jgi:hypothetical protein
MHRSGKLVAHQQAAIRQGLHIGRSTTDVLVLRKPRYQRLNDNTLLPFSGMVITP